MSQIPKASIYTKKGDLGTTSLVDGTFVSKNHPRVEAYGDVDELNSVLGALSASLQISESTLHDSTLKTDLFRIQNHLFNLGSLLACENAEILSRLPALTPGHVEWLEKRIDSYNVHLPKLNEFILPGGHASAAWAHLARTVCRRAERKVAGLELKATELDSSLIYLNRLSDFFFTLARWIHLKTGTPEIKWDAKA